MTALLRLLCLVVFTSAQFDSQYDDSDSLLDSSFARDIEEAIFGSDSKTITIFTNFDDPSDQFFFQNVLPWLVDNIGNRLRINFHFRSSARRSGPRTCALRALRANTYMQAEFLRCETRGNPTSNCVDDAPIDRRQYNRCLSRRVHEYVRTSQTEFDKLIAEQTPIILVGRRREVTADNPMRLLRMICQSFGRTKPAGCLRPVPLPRTATRNIPAPTNIVTVTRFMNDSQPAELTNILTMPLNDDPHPYDLSAAISHSNPLPFQLGLHFVTFVIFCYIRDSFL